MPSNRGFLPKRGEPNYNGNAPLDDENWGDLSRLMSKVVLDEANGCWLFLNGGHSRVRGGVPYGRIWNGPTRLAIPAHRAAWLWLVGPIPPGFVLDHYRLNPGPREAPCSTLCVFPGHLEIVTQKENVLRGRSFFAENARKTHCPNGHPLVEGNLRPKRTGGRGECRTCYEAYMKRYHPEHAAKYNAHRRAKRAALSQNAATDS